MFRALSTMAFAIALGALVGFAADKLLAVDLKPVMDGVSAKGQVMYQASALDRHGQPWFACRVALSPTSLTKLGLDAKNLGAGRVLLTLPTANASFPMRLAYRKDGQPQAAMWSLSLVGEAAPKVTRGEKLWVAINGHVVLAGILQ